MKNTIFGTVNEQIKVMNREHLEDGLTRTTFKYGKFTVVGVSNEPSTEAIKRMAENMNRIAEKYVNEELEQNIA
ncbi:acyl-CoA thioester hydrolase [Bacillus paranthracis]|uniref:acyl-CoA thioester hydrolase n=1 Tax=Bacillus TaxID=1386 RepID=UPI002252F078|nr:MULTISPECIES: acyl-CoA thioester hydrolase [Bacillus cereus group]MCX3319414.1 acyl-CoA thioester hydrolase [Bacillus paranthracis]MDA1744044.1 acyl-CoA thioester hydrolase [Bacillus cereus group sp. LD121LC]MDK7417101.1 acyl-CoA thioester hydrolase [Bacillus paranthracis]MDK7427878.1 acyl-CoA thioester hydrolase [Bacillus paranthracis]MDK7514653.1 acyl-CoA thioester hydrolase [Bacillus paranthracis]